MKLSIPEVLDKSHLPSLDGYRGIAILLVLIEHTFPSALLPFNGGYGVYIFFGISGFLITTLLLKEKAKTGRVSLRMFYIRRVLRIFPVAYLMIFVLLIINFVLDLEIPSSEFLGAALYLQNTSLFSVDHSYLSHYWSLSIEEQFYFIFPAFIRGRAGIYIAIVFLLIALAPVISYLHVFGIVTSRSFVLIDEILRFMPALLIGSLFSVVLCYRVITIPARIPYRSVIVLFLLIAGGYLISQPAILLSTSVAFTVAYVLVGLMIVLSLVPGNDPMFRLLNNRVLATIGIYSYSIYIWQQIFAKHRPWRGMFPGSDSDILNLAVLAVVCYVSYNFYEKKFLLLKDRFR